MGDLAQNLRPAVSLSAEVLFHFGRWGDSFRPKLVEYIKFFCSCSKKI